MNIGLGLGHWIAKLQNLKNMSLDKFNSRGFVLAITSNRNKMVPFNKLLGFTFIPEH